MKLKNALELNSEKDKSPSVCEACGAEFACGAGTESSCWCFDIKLSEKTGERLKSKFKNCLCKNCLEKFNSAEVLK
jgi:hypothetical protein